MHSTKQAKQWVSKRACPLHSRARCLRRCARGRGALCAQRTLVFLAASAAAASGAAAFCSLVATFDSLVPTFLDALLSEALISQNIRG